MTIHLKYSCTSAETKNHLYKKKFFHNLRRVHPIYMSDVDQINVLNDVCKLGVSPLHGVGGTRAGVARPEKKSVETSSTGPPVET